MLGAVGIGVSDIKKSVHFYTEVLGIGLRKVQTFDVETYYEVLLAFPKGTPHAGSPILLMEYKDPKLPKPVNQQGKFIFYVPEVKPVLDRCKAYGSTVLIDLGANKSWPRMTMFTDPDGFVVELMPLSVLAPKADKSKL